MKRIALVFAIAICFGLTAQGQGMVGNWTVKSIVLESDMVYLLPSPETFRFNADGTVTGNGGCNMYNGKYLFTSKKSLKKPQPIKFSDIISVPSFAPCANATAAETELAFLESLRNAATVTIVNGELIIKSKAKTTKSTHGTIAIQNTLTLTHDAAPKVPVQKTGEKLK